MDRFDQKKQERYLDILNERRRKITVTIVSSTESRGWPDCHRSSLFNKIRRLERLGHIQKNKKTEKIGTDSIKNADLKFCHHSDVGRIREGDEVRTKHKCSSDFERFQFHFNLLSQGYQTFLNRGP